MKKAKRLVSLLLAFVMLLSLTVVVGAADNNNTVAGNASYMSGQDGNCSITITNALPGATYKLYQILYLESFNEDAKAYSYKASDQWNDWVNGAEAAEYLTVDANTQYVTWTNGDTSGTAAQAFAQLALTEAKKEGSTINPVATITAADINANAKGEVSISFTGLKQGYYLIDTTQGALCNLDTFTKDVEISIKQTSPSLEKTVKEGSSYRENSHSNIGDKVEFRSRLTIPVGSENIVYHDSMSEGLTFNNDVKVYIIDASENATEIANNANKYYQITTSTPYSCNDLGKCDFHVVFTDDFITDYANSTQCRINIEYTATLNEKATLGKENPNTNDAEISYGDNGRFTKKVETETYSFEIPIFKYTNTSVAMRDEIKDTVQTPLSGAKFKITIKTPVTPDKITNVNDSDWLTFSEVKDADGNLIAYKYDKNGSVKEFVSGTDGYIKLQGLDAGTYYLYESEAPGGYNILGGSTTITIDLSLKKDEDPCKIGNIYKGVNLSTPVTEIGIENNTGAVMPSTGGIGTTIFYVAGSILLIGAAVLLIVKKRMGDEK